MENHLIYYLETYTFSEIIAQATIFTVLVVVLHHFFEIFPCFHYQTVLITDAKVIYCIGTAIRANGDLLFIYYYLMFNLSYCNYSIELDDIPSKK